MQIIMIILGVRVKRTAHRFSALFEESFKVLSDTSLLSECYIGIK